MGAVARIVGRIRLLRGRCPSCNSEADAARCRTCFGYEGPFPASEATLARWNGRFARIASAPGNAPPTAQPVAAEPFPAR